MKIYITTKPKDILRVATKVEHMKHKPFTKEQFADYMLKRVVTGNTIILIAKENTEERRIYATAVLTLIQEFKDKVIWIDYTWVDKSKKELGKQLMDQVEDVARIYDADKIQGRVYKGTSAARKKYGFSKAYEVIEKSIDKEKDNGRNE